MNNDKNSDKDKNFNNSNRNDNNNYFRPDNNFRNNYDNRNRDRNYNTNFRYNDRNYGNNNSRYHDYYNNYNYNNYRYNNNNQSNYGRNNTWHDNNQRKQIQYGNGNRNNYQSYYNNSNNYRGSDNNQRKQIQYNNNSNNYRGSDNYNRKQIQYNNNDYNMNIEEIIEEKVDSIKNKDDNDFNVNNLSGDMLNDKDNTFMTTLKVNDIVTSNVDTNFEDEIKKLIKECESDDVIFYIDDLLITGKNDEAQLNNIKKSLHEGHLGAGKIKSLAKDYMWWPGINNDIVMEVKSCDDCNIYHDNPIKIQKPWVSATKPNIKIDLDIALGKFLFNYRNTRNDTTGVTPSQRMFNRDIRIKWDLLKPLEEKENKINVTLPRNRTFNIGDFVWYKVQGDDKWCKDMITHKESDMMFQIKIEKGILRRHLDQIRIRNCFNTLINYDSKDSFKEGSGDKNIKITDNNDITPISRPVRIKQKPVYLKDYVT
ncbi:probable serine/threonine-protein kinase clkA [Gordionus sp. m RMFG-2023]|uniref:probable serine/threonine-protein kinase clkA n=1 Tax=Gordionus sp. m RMFG-2023 TaxID=3053472 RepID=UPI0031FBBA11